jgi:hypothetical protein
MEHRVHHYDTETRVLISILKKKHMHVWTAESIETAQSREDDDADVTARGEINHGSLQTTWSDPLDPSISWIYALDRKGSRYDLPDQSYLALSFRQRWGGDGLTICTSVPGHFTGK